MVSRTPIAFQVRPTVHFDVEASSVFLWRDFLSRLTAQTVFFKSNLRPEFRILCQIGEFLEIVFERPGPTVLPTVFQIDADQFRQHRPVKRVTGFGEKVGQVGLGIPRLGRFKCCNQVFQLIQHDRIPSPRAA